MKNKVLLFSLLFIVIFSAITIFLTYFSFENESTVVKKINQHKLKNGDLILRCGRSPESYAVHLADSKATFSHIGIISIEHNEIFVIHAVPNENQFIKKDKIHIFLSPKNASKYAIYRTPYSQNILKNVVFEAQSFYNKKYTFDNDYDLNSNSKLYCTELILKAFQNSGINLKIKPKPFNYVLGKHQIIFPSEFTKPPLFYKIY